MTRKVLESYKHGWRGLLAQFLIMILLVLVMLALGSPTVTNVKEDLHPELLPPPFYRLQPTPVLTIPFTSTGLPVSELGSCCTNNSGLLGNIDFGIQNETTKDGSSLGMYFPTDAFTFVPYSVPVDMYQYFYDNNKAKLTTGYLFNSYSVGDTVVLEAAAMRNVSEPYAVMGYIGLLANAFYRTALNSSYSLTLRIKDFPAKKHVEKEYEGSSEATWVVLGCSFFMVQILSYVVREKQQRQRYLMKMSGMRMSVYWIVMFWVHFVIYSVLLLFFYALSAATLMPFFSSNSGQIIVSDYLIFVFNQIALAFLISSFSTNAHTIALGAYIYIVALVVATSYINPVFADEQFATKSSVLYGTAIIPQIAFGRVTSILLYHFFPDRVALSFSQVADLPHLKYMFVILCLTGIAFLILHQYFERVFPSEFGKSLHPAFFVLPKFWRNVFSKDEDTKSIDSYKGPAVSEPADVSAERATALSSPNLPLCVPGISKVFKDDNAEKVAVNNLAFCVGKAECFGVLGPNGGGKTTLVNILCGLYTPTSGTAFIDTHNIDTHLELAQRHIGVCPQDSVLFNDLTGREHLMLFGKLRNLQGAALELAVDLALQQVLLTDAQHRQAGGYSGGMKRRLSLAIALIGNPKVVMLDEPSTGVDPFSRRVLWDVIQSYKKYTTIVLITHSMEEAEALCDRVCMVSDGTMRCIGRPIELKARYGVGYNLTIMYKPGMQTSADNIVSFVKHIVGGSKVIQIVSNTIIFSLPKANMKLSDLFASIQERKEELNIADWGLLQSSLEDVLLQATGVVTD